MIPSFNSFLKESFEKSMGLETYYYLKENLSRTNVSTDKTYQTIFNRFYRVRRNKEWRDVFYGYFETIKNKKSVSFEEIIKYLYEHTGSVEASFSSKLLSTINPEMPILDQFVLQNLGIKKELTSDKDFKLKNAIDIYQSVIDKEKALLEKEEIQSFIRDFKAFFPEYDLTDTRILDLLLWGVRE